MGRLPSYSESAQGKLPRNTKANPREHLKVITLRSQKQLEMRMETSSVQEERSPVETHGNVKEERGQSRDKE